MVENRFVNVGIACFLAIFRKGKFEGFFKIIDQKEYSPSFHSMAPIAWRPLHGARKKVCERKRANNRSDARSPTFGWNLFGQADHI